MKSEVLNYRADDLDMVGHLYWDQAIAGERPAVLVFPDARGLGDHAKMRAEMLAKMGYVALACDLHGGAFYCEDVPKLFEMLKPLHRPPERLRARSQAAYDLLVARPEVDRKKVAAIGYCIGGAMALEIARMGNDLAGSVAFHGRIVTEAPDGASKIKGKVLAILGAGDPYIPLEQRLAFENEMEAAKVDWRLHVYGGVVHSFTMEGIERLGETEGNRYDPAADARSWNEMSEFLDEIFQGAQG